MARSVKQLVDAANAVVPRITVAKAQELIAEGNTLVVDVREGPEVQQSGKVAGAVHVPRGMLEFLADPEAPSHDPRFGKDKTVIVYCASGGRSALAGQVLKEMGYGEVYCLGVFQDWADGGGAMASTRPLRSSDSSAWTAAGITRHAHAKTPSSEWSTARERAGAAEMSSRDRGTVMILERNIEPWGPLPHPHTSWGGSVSLPLCARLRARMGRPRVPP